MCAARRRERHLSGDGNTMLFGMKERDGWIAARVIPNIKKATLRSVTLRNV